MTIEQFFHWADEIEYRACKLANSFSHRQTIRSLFRAVSRLGDGVFWYSLMLIMPVLVDPLHPYVGLKAAIVMLLSGGLGLVIYKVLKTKMLRERPFIGLIGIECAMPPLDHYSFPSGHTLHAVLFSTIAVHFCPSLAIVLVPFTCLIAASRVVLGLHYPSDVLVGAFLGWLVARVGLLFAAQVMFI
jgi:undecaprenyl-diphosphatase